MNKFGDSGSVRFVIADRMDPWVLKQCVKIAISGVIGNSTFRS